MSCDFSTLAVPGIRELTPYEPGKPIEELERELGLKNTLKLASNENPLGPSPEALATLRGGLERLSFYPDGNGFALRTAIAARHGIAPECVTLGNGSNEILELIARVFLAPGREAAFAAHAFAVYPLVVQAVGAESKIAAPNPPDHAMPYGHDLAALAEKINARTRVVFIANPNNPTGTWLKADHLRAFIGDLPAEVLAVVDEAYFEYVQADGYATAASWLAEVPNLIVTRTFSKIYGLAGLRIGYGLSHPQVAELLNRARQPFNTNSLAQIAALAALADEAHLSESIAINAAGLAQFARAFEARGLDIIPSVANFISVNVGRPALPVYQALLREGVIVRPITSYGLPEHLRITVGREADNDRVIAALDKVLAS